MAISILRALTLVLGAAFASSAAGSEGKFDIALRGGRVVDGTGAPWYRADVGLRDGKIARIGRIAEDEAETSLDVTGLVVAPGFIDMMGQTASPLLEDSSYALNLLTQGITTINCGEGASAAPLDEAEAKSAGWSTMAEYFQLLQLKGLPVNVAQTVGHTQVRRLVLGEVDRRPSPEELARMKDLVAEAMRAGAIGVSTALIYPPAVYARTEEIAALAQVASEHGGGYYTHMRNEGDRLLEAIDEALDIGRQADAPVHIFHLKAACRTNWPKIEQAIARIKAARADGQQVTADIYPYVNNGLGIAAFIHPRHFAQGRGRLLASLDDPKLREEIRREMETTGGWENWFRHVGGDWDKVVVGHVSDARYAELAGQSVAAMAKARDEDPWETFFDLVKAGAFALPESMTEANKLRLLREEFVSFCTDVGPAGGSRIASHPRAYGSFPRLLSRYVRELGAVSLEQAVSQASAVAANDIFAFDRGRIALGLAADLVVFDYEKIADRATFAKPDGLSTGVVHVLVNGELVLRDGDLTGKLPGRVLRGPGYQKESASHAIQTGSSSRGLAVFDETMRSFMKAHRIPGAALAVTDAGRLVHARGYGYADIASGERVRPTSLFRIASVSKPITAVAILQLVERGELKLDDKVLDLLLHEAHLTEGATFDERQRRITVRHLLQHRGGWDREVSFDAMFQTVRFARALGLDPPASPDDVIRFMLGQRLDFDPGERYAYSNYGYCLLGRVIERLSGQSYEDHVRKSVLAPLGIHSMRIGCTRLEGRRPGEVRYYDPTKGPSVFAEDLDRPTPRPYGAWYLEAMDSHGAWIASAVDLARFACALVDPENCPILKPESLRVMHARPPGRAGHNEDGSPTDVYYSLGWINRSLPNGQRSHWHTGSLGGTAAILIRRPDGRNLIALFNARSGPRASHFGRAIDAPLNRATSAVEQWPEADLFSRFSDAEGR